MPTRFTNTTARFLTLVCTLFGLSAGAQQITGLWEGKIGNNKVEVKIIQKGDSLTGTSYYYSGAGNYRRYSIKGYFDQQTNEVIWWDDHLIEGRDGRTVSRNGIVPMLSHADFNCPGGGKMMLDGKASKKDDEKPSGKVALEKTYQTSQFPDEWDYVLENYTVGANDPDIIDSIGLITGSPVTPPPPAPVFIEPKPDPRPVPVPVPAPEPSPARPEPVAIQKEATPPPVALPSPPPVVTKPLTIEDKFIARQKVFTKEILVEGDSVELRFYDNAQVDGDSISLFLNNRMLFTHVRLTEKPYSIKLPVSDLDASNELIMVAENLGSIPPNTSYMVAIVGEQRYDAYLTSTEQSSAMIRLRKK